jgi:hypothetical protein
MDSKYTPWVIFFNSTFICSIFLFILNERYMSSYDFPIIRSYLNDIIAPVIVLSITRFFLSMYTNRCYILSVKQLFFFLVYMSLIFELVLPSFSQQYTSDVIDIIAYLIGVLIFQFFNNKNEHKTKNNKKKKCEA